MNAIISGSFVIENTVHPTIGFNIEIDYRQSEVAIIDIHGWLKTNSDLILAPLFGTTGKTSNSSLTTQSQKLSGSNTSMDSNLFKDSKYYSQLFAQLDEKALEQIEDIRSLDIQKAVEIKVELLIKYIKSNIQIAHFFYVEPPDELLQKIKSNPPFTLGEETIHIIMSTYREKFNSSRDAGWILSGKNSPTFLSLQMDRIELMHRIDVATWINEYAHKLGLGRRILLEIPSEGETFQHIMQYLSNAENAFRRWETKSVFANCREIGKNLDYHLKDVYGNNTFVYKERWGRAYANFEKFASLDLHIEDIKRSYGSQDVSIDKNDAEYLLIQTKNLIKYAQELGKKYG